jgi:predicted  nucleic acid-binding Zn-ribbon protein
MTPMSRPFKLYRLQQIDSQLDEAQARLEEIAAILGEDEALKAAKQAVAETEEARGKAEKELRRAEEDVQAQQIKIEHNQSTLYGGKVTNPKELQDLQAEAEALQRHLGALEDVQLEKMLAHEDAGAALKAAQQRQHEIETERAKEHGELGQEREVLLKEVERLNGDREAAASGIPDEDMRQYLALRESKGGMAVAKVKDKTCGACGATLSHALAQAARSPNDLSHCSSCKRILYSG